MLTPLAQTLVFGILVGALYGLVALGLSLVFGVTKLLNVAHGELLMIGGFASFWAFSLLGINPYLTIPISMVVLFLLGAVLYKLIFSRTVKLPEESKIKNTLLVAFGLSIILQNLALKFWTADERAISTPILRTAIKVAGIRLPYARLANLLIAVFFLVVLQLFLRKTYIGKAIRATVQNWEAASLMGINIQRVYLLAFAIGASLAGVAGTLVAINFSIQPNMGLTWTLKALIVMVLGGLGSIPGTFIGGLVLGLTESATSFFINSNYREIAGLVLFLLVLIFRPQGLMGAKET
ncbi:MAG: branched-chain amino acid ABC transporter permease [Anaerolineales bacterium]|nr:branched-chain amino acid ABC transporter permease [Anaerolineae bacterium]PWB56257.1 MAG: branched-chain amino acid ABC transporter permease [Anaerolineales bacterium]